MWDYYNWSRSSNRKHQRPAALLLTAPDYCSKIQPERTSILRLRLMLWSATAVGLTPFLMPSAGGDLSDLDRNVDAMSNTIIG